MANTDVLADSQVNGTTLWANFHGQTVGCRVLTFKPKLFGWKVYVEIADTEGNVLHEWVNSRKIWS